MCQGCKQAYVGRMFRRVIESTPKGKLPLGFCPECNEKYEKDMKAFEKTYKGRGLPVPKGDPDTAYEPEDEPDMQLSIAVEEEQELPEELSFNDFDRNEDVPPMPDWKERDDDDRDEYWK